MLLHRSKHPLHVMFWLRWWPRANNFRASIYNPQKSARSRISKSAVKLFFNFLEIAKPAIQTVDRIIYHPRRRPPGPPKGGWFYCWKIVRDGRFMLVNSYCINWTWNDYYYFRELQKIINGRMKQTTAKMSWAKNADWLMRRLFMDIIIINYIVNYDIRMRSENAFHFLLFACSQKPLYLPFFYYCWLNCGLGEKWFDVERK